MCIECGLVLRYTWPSPWCVGKDTETEIHLNYFNVHQVHWLHWIGW